MARVWDTLAGASLLELKGHTGTVWTAVFSPDGQRMLTGSEDRTAKVWDARRGTPLLELKGHTNAVKSVAFSSDNTRIHHSRAAGTGRAGEGMGRGYRGPATRSRRLPPAIGRSIRSVFAIAWFSARTAREYSWAMSTARSRCGTRCRARLARSSRPHTRVVTAWHSAPDGTRILTFAEFDGNGQDLGRTNGDAPPRAEGSHGQPDDRGVQRGWHAHSRPAAATRRPRCGMHDRRRVRSNSKPTRAGWQRGI